MGQIEVLNNLKGWGAWDYQAYRLEKNEADIVINALVKQRPLRLEAETIGTFTVSGNCPSCHNAIISKKEGEGVTNYCRWCGQRITWQGKDESNEK